MEGKELAALRDRLGLSQKEFARRVGISRSQLYDYEAGWKRGTRPLRPAPIPRPVELAALYLEEHLDPHPEDVEIARKRIAEISEAPDRLIEGEELPERLAQMGHKQLQQVLKHVLSFLNK